MSEETVSVPAFRVQQHSRSLILLRLRAGDLSRISYVASRAESSEKNAVQRVLTKSRIAGIAEFALSGGDFPASIVLNWVSSTKIKVLKGVAKISLAPSSAQLLDGQHRVAGLREAIKTDASAADIELPVAVYENLTSQECADIFLSINTEQKPVSRTLVYDLYGIASDVVRDPDAMAAKKIADELNEKSDSPYYGMIKYPKSPAGTAGVSLSSVVGVLKPLLQENGVLAQVGLDAEHAKDRAAVIMNWLKVIRHAYGTQWSDKGNIFRYASGFWGAMQFLSTIMLKHCFLRDSFDEMTMRKAMSKFKDNLIWQKDVAGMQGRRSAELVFQHLNFVYTESNKGSRTKIKI